MSYIVTEDDYLTIDGVPMSTTAWRLKNSFVLWEPADTRGTNALIPGATGVRPRRIRSTETQKTLQLTVWGEENWNGVEYADPERGLWLNLEHFKTNVVAPPDNSTGTRTAVLYVPDAGTGSISGSIQVRKMRLDALNPTTLDIELDITIPGGALS